MRKQKTASAPKTVAKKKKKDKFLDIWTLEKIRLFANSAISFTANSATNFAIGSAANFAFFNLTRANLNKYVESKLKETIEYAMLKSPFYREKLTCLFSEKRICTMDAKVFKESFGKIPFTTADELRRRGLEFLCIPPNEISRIVTLDTGGSTGEPKRIYFTEEDQRLTIDYFKNGMQLIVDSTDKVLILMPANRPGSIGLLLAQALGDFGAETIAYGLPKMERSEKSTNEIRHYPEAVKLLNLIKKESITSVVALPTHMRILAEVFREALSCTDGGVSFIAPKLNSVLLSAEYVSDEEARLIESVFDCKVYEHYGMTEMGLGCAVSCGQGTGYHIREADLYIEIVDPQTGEVIEDDRRGEIVFTTLTRKGMPFIRYRTGDYSKWIDEECPCGSVLKRIAKVEPRGETKGYLR